LKTSYPTLQKQLLKLIVTIQVLVFVMLYWVLESYVSALIQDNFVDTARTTAVETADVLVQMDVLGEAPAIESALEQILLKPRVVYAEIVLEGQRYLPKLLAELGNGVVTESRFSEDYRVGDHDDQTYYLSMPLIDGNRLTFLRIGFDESDVQRALVTSRWAIFAALFTTALLSISAVWMFGRRLTRPVLDLAEASRKIAEGQSDGRLRVKTRIHELDLLSHSLDDMHVKLQSRNRRLKHLASTDALTGIPNRLAFSNFLSRELGGDSDQVFGLVIIDINRFKEINDNYGHVVGDHVVSAVAHRLKKLSRDGDLIARIGGDEFALVLRDMSEIGIRRFCVAITEQVSRPIEVNELSLKISASIGATLIEGSQLSTEDCIHQADMAMYEAKRSGDDYRLFGKQQFEESIRETLIKKALSAGIESFSGLGLRVHYQPRFDMSRFRVTGVEALLRWEHHEYGSLSPEQFLPIAESDGLIGKLTDFVLDTAAAQAREWFELGHTLPISVNLSAWDLKDERIETRLNKIFQRYEIPYQLLEMEVSESLALRDLESCATVLTGLHRLGIVSCLDGVRGRLSDSMLQALPARSLKLDRHWVKESLRSTANLEVLKTFLDRAHALQMTIIATGAETEEMTAMLSEANCDELQGFHFSRPVPPSFIETNFLAE